MKCIQCIFNVRHESESTLRFEAMEAKNGTEPCVYGSMSANRAEYTFIERGASQEFVESKSLIVCQNMRLKCI